MNKTEKHFSLQEDKKKRILKTIFYHDKWQTIILLDFWKYCKILLKSTRFCKNLKVSTRNCKMLQDSIKFLQNFAKFYQDSVMLKWKIFKVSLKSYKIVCTHETDSFLAIIWSKMDPEGPWTQFFGVEGLCNYVPSYPWRN